MSQLFVYLFMNFYYRCRYDTTTPLVEAIRRRRADLVCRLLEQGADVNAGPPFPLIEAAILWLEDIVRILLDQKVIDVNSTQWVEFPDNNDVPMRTDGDMNALDVIWATPADGNRKASKKLLVARGLKRGDTVQYDH
jgi:hypothetical protein